MSSGRTVPASRSCVPPTTHGPATHPTDPDNRSAVQALTYLQSDVKAQKIFIDSVVTILFVLYRVKNRHIRVFGVAKSSDKFRKRRLTDVGESVFNRT